MSDKSKELRKKLTSFSVSTTDKIMHLMTSKERFYQINKPRQKMGNNIKIILRRYFKGYIYERKRNRIYN